MRSRRSPERLRYRRGSGVCPTSSLSLPVEALAKYFKTSSFLSPGAAGCTEPPRRCLALPTLSVPFLPPRSFSRQLLTPATFEGAPGQVAESDGARDKSAAGKVGRRRAPRARMLTEHLPASGWREEERREPGLLKPPRGAELVSSSHQPPCDGRPWEMLLSSTTSSPR